MAVSRCAGWVVLVGTLGCRPESPEPSAGDVTATGAPSLHVASVLVVTADGPMGVARVEYGDDFEHRTPDSPAATHHVLPVLGLKPAQVHPWRVVVTDDAGVEHVSEAGTFETPIPPPVIPQLDLTVSEPDATVSFVLASIVDQPDASAIGIIDRDGQWVWWMTVPPGQIIITPELSPDGRSVVWAEYATDLTADSGYAVRVALDGSERVDTRLPLGHHDIVPHDDGTVAYIGMEFGALLTDDGAIRIATDQIRVATEGATEGDPTDLVFDMIDDFPHHAVLTCAHMQQPWRRFDDQESFEWTHANSIVYVPEEDAYYLNQRFTDWILKIDRSSGALLWTMSGLHGEFTLPGGEAPYLGINQNRLWSHSHFSDVWPGGAMVFDNGDHSFPPRSRALEIAWDEERREVAIVWEMPHPGGGQAGALGDVRRMPEDHVLITWSALREVMEVDRDHEILWKVEVPGDTAIGRIVPIESLYAP